MAKSIIEKKLAKKRAGERKPKISTRNNGYSKSRSIVTPWPPHDKSAPDYLIRQVIADEV